MSTQKQAVETEAKKAMSAEEAFHTNQHDQAVYRAKYRAHAQSRHQGGKDAGTHAVPDHQDRHGNRYYVQQQFRIYVGHVHLYSKGGQERPFSERPGSLGAR